MNALQKHYQEKVVPALMEEFSITNRMAVPKIEKIVLNIGLKEAAHDKGVLEKTTAWMTEISGQKPKLTKAKISIANFKLREGDPVGLTVTLRGKRMYDFLIKLISIALPRVRDFGGVPTTSFDSQGNYTLGLTEQIIFPEVDYSKIDRVRGLEATLVTRSGNVKIAQRLLALMGMPFKKEAERQRRKGTK
ncbi:MAG: 50S ribosomal protein L5 [Candidatus Amesbacteria bacterium GW2011_GWA1_47_16]|uniref:Large ribosomal subunit protein uL5 n=7 Tax=Microgenomates group TaxID=1794810 RepID=A0A0H4TEU5_9BACT|nr:50S ribosomal protein L5, large subunit ribosomal protein L5 [uncultured Microgenomates bacterium Rifle_16ft_4_minimus_1180]AKQ05520.1 50S ribosomal protein L5, large subunit ribosomal protein L5 [uncultured Microgenomates bacterium Rifle_16ft_4_minimus_26042]KKU63234.1 MAG: 50S ribosomal protein L5 [Candidatus Amesbacteria bacterium GW2011_GWC1_47_15]KKU63304.1 MAG: 50S ribosomal protein L5 [Candidatus Amesbacteria bacterium GW2011_GWA1_47_16]KKU96780.1 MAG: 50S ribosomal protein L5 [Candid